MLVPEFYKSQARIRDDWSEYLLIKKGRRVGGTFALAYKHVAARLKGVVRRDLMFAAHNQRTSDEFVGYCKQFCELFDHVAVALDVEREFDGKRVTQTIINLPGNIRIIAMPGKPSAMRGFGGDVILDEFALHEQAEEMYEAAQPVIMRGGTLTVLSTVKGTMNLFWSFCKEATKYADGVRESGGRELTPWTLIELPLSKAVEEGLVEQINKFSGTNYSREEFLRKVRRGCRSQAMYEQEYECVPDDGAGSWLTNLVIARCVHDLCPMPNTGLSPHYAGGPCYAGIDVGRTRDLTVCWIDEAVGDVLWTRRVDVIMHAEIKGGVSIPEQSRQIYGWLTQVRLVRGCVDYTGLGIGLGDFLVEKLGSRIECITFTNANKDAIATALRDAAEDVRIRIPDDDDVRNDFGRVKQIVTATGKIRLDAARVEDHADRFWAKGLAVYAAGTPQDIRISIVEPETNPAEDLDVVEMERRARLARASEHAGVQEVAA